MVIQSYNVLFRCRKHRRLETKKTFIVACDMACWIVSHPCSRLMSTTTIFFSNFPKTFLHLKRSAMIPWATIWRRWWPIAILGTENLQLWVKYIFSNNSSNMSTNQRILNCGWKKKHLKTREISWTTIQESLRPIIGGRRHPQPISSHSGSSMAAATRAGRQMMAPEKWKKQEQQHHRVPEQQQQQQQQHPT